MLRVACSCTSASTPLTHLKFVAHVHAEGYCYHYGRTNVLFRDNAGTTCSFVNAAHAGLKAYFVRVSTETT